MRRVAPLLCLTAGCTLGTVHYPEVGSNHLGWIAEDSGQIVDVSEIEGPPDTGTPAASDGTGADTGSSGDTGASDTGASDTGASDTGASDTGSTTDTGAVAP